MNEPPVQPAHTNESIFAQMDHLSMKTRRIKLISWLSFLLYPVLLLLPSVLGFEIDAGGAITAIPYGAATIVGPIVVFCIFRNWAASVARKYDSYTGFFKTEVVKAELDAAFQSPAFEETGFEPENGWPKQFIESLQLFKSFNIYDSNDWIQGRYSGIPFEQADINLTDEQQERYWDSDDNKYKTRTVRTPIFYGRMIKLSFANRFPTSLRIVSNNIDGVEYSSFSQTTVMGRVKVNSASMAGWESIETESVDLTGAFHSFAKNAASALTMLTPQVILGIISLKNKLTAPLILSFKANQLYVFIQTGGNAFEISASEKVEEQKNKVKKDVAFIVRSLEAITALTREMVDSAAMEPME